MQRLIASQREHAPEQDKIRAKQRMLDTLKQIAELKDGWGNSQEFLEYFGAHLPAISPIAVRVANTLVESVPGFSYAFEVVPQETGGIFFMSGEQFDWSCEITISPQGTVTCYVINYGGHEPERREVFNLTPESSMDYLSEQVKNFIEKNYYTHVDQSFEKQVASSTYLKYAHLDER